MPTVFFRNQVLKTGIMARMRLPRTWFPETDGIFSRYSSAVSSRIGVSSMTVRALIGNRMY